jgi:hypothetical protein
MSIYPRYLRKYMNKKVLQENAGIKTDTIIDKMYFDSSELIREINTLIECRKKWGHTQEQVAIECGVSIPTIKRSKKLLIEAPYYQEGAQLSRFNVEHLDLAKLIGN